MWYRIVALFAGLLFSALLACSSTPTPVDDQAQDHRDRPEQTVGEVFEAASAWLPAGSALAAGGVDPTSWYFDDQHLLPTADPGGEPGDPGTLEGLQRDLERLFRAHLGFDPGRTEAWFIGGGLDGGTAVLFGDFDEPEGFEEIEINDRKGYQLPLDTTNFDQGELFEWTYLLPIDEPRPGLVLAGSIEQLERLDAETNGDESQQSSLATGPYGDTYATLFEDVGHASWAVASPIGEIASIFGVHDSIPHAAAFSFGDVLRLTFIGDDADLSSLQLMVDHQIEEMRTKIEENYRRQDPELVDEYTAVYGYHSFESIARQLDTPKVTDGRLHYEVAIRDFNWGVITMMGTSILVALWDGWSTVDEWLGPDTVWRTADPQDFVRERSWDAAHYFESPQRNCGQQPDCLEPWHETGAGPGAPIAGEDKVFPGGPNIAVTNFESFSGEPAQTVPQPQFIGDPDVTFEAEDVLRMFTIDGESSTDMRLIYETGPGTGTEATAKITVETVDSLEPWSDERTAVTQMLEVDSAGQVVFSDLIVADRRRSDER